MRRTFVVAVLVVAALTSKSVPGCSQVDTVARTSADMPAPQSLGTRPASLWVWVQSGSGSFRTDMLGGFPDARLLESGLRWHHTLHRSGWFSVVAIPDLVTLSSLSRINDSHVMGYGARAVEILTRDGHAYGVGTLPLAIRAAVDERKPLSGFLDLSAGLQYFSRAIPDVRATHLNAQLMAGAGVRGAIGQHVEAELAYRLVHISNGDTGEVNPGLNFRQVAVGVGFRPRKQ